jgi:MFS transporter, ACS family, D-galactonate transporter
MFPRQRPSRRYSVLAWFCAAAAIAYVQRTSIGIAAKDIQASLELSVPAMGNVMGGYYWAYALSQLPAGWIGQRWGTRASLTFFMTGTSVWTALVACTTSSADLTLVWLLAGMAIAGIFPACAQAIAQWFAPDERAFPSGALGSAMSVGGALSSVLTGWLLGVFATLPGSWRWIFCLYALPGLAWAVGFAVWYRDPVKVAPANDTSAAPDSDDQSPSPHLRAALDYDGWWLDRRTWLVCAQQFFRAAGYVFYATWFPSFLQETRGVSTAAAGILTSLPLLGVVIGGVVGGSTIDAIERAFQNRRVSRQLVGVISHLGCAGFIFAAQPIRDPVFAVALITGGSFVFAFGSATSYAITMDLGGRRTATLFALMNMCGNIGAAICPSVIGLLIPRIGWEPLLFVFGGIYLAAAACWMFLNPESEVHASTML